MLLDRVHVYVECYRTIAGWGCGPGLCQHYMLKKLLKSMWMLMQR